MAGLPPRSTLFPYTTLFRSLVQPVADHEVVAEPGVNPRLEHGVDEYIQIGPLRARQSDRKSTRLNSSHMSISYAVFCLKKKNTNQPTVQKIPPIMKQALPSD